MPFSTQSGIIVSLYDCNLLPYSNMYYLTMSICFRGRPQRPPLPAQAQLLAQQLSAQQLSAQQLPAQQLPAQQQPAPAHSWRKKQPKPKKHWKLSSDPVHSKSSASDSTPKSEPESKPQKDEPKVMEKSGKKPAPIPAPIVTAAPVAGVSGGGYISPGGGNVSFPVGGGFMSPGGNVSSPVGGGFMSPGGNLNPADEAMQDKFANELRGRKSKVGF